VAGWSKGKEMPELKESLNIIRTAASELISAIEEKTVELIEEKKQTSEHKQDVQIKENLGHEETKADKEKDVPGKESIRKKLKENEKAVSKKKSKAKNNREESR
jgi:hypothetical protein